jgi:hypothetical protein
MALARSSPALPGAGSDGDPTGIPALHATSEYLHPSTYDTSAHIGMSERSSNEHWRAYRPTMRLAVRHMIISARPRVSAATRAGG